MRASGSICSEWETPSPGAFTCSPGKGSGSGPLLNQKDHGYWCGGGRFKSLRHICLDVSPQYPRVLLRISRPLLQCRTIGLLPFLIQPSFFNFTFTVKTWDCSSFTICHLVTQYKSPFKCCQGNLIFT